MEELEELYVRQKPLNLKTVNKVTVIGLGGIGSWVALDMALAGAKTMILIDNDKIETTNLNRTPYKFTQIGMFKTQAMKDLIIERRFETEVITFEKKLETLTKAELSKLRSSIIIDTRDNLVELDVGIKPDYYVRYDGLSATIMTELPDAAFTSGTRGYNTVPSFIATPQFLAALVTAIVFTGYEFQHTKTFRNILEVIE